MNLKKILFMMIVAFTIIGFAGCSKKKATLSVDKTDVVLLEGESFTVVPTTENIKKPNFVLKSLDTTVVKVTGLKIEALKAGSTKVEVTVDGYKDLKVEINVTVNRPKQPFLAIEGAKDLNIGEELTLITIKKDIDEAVVWESSNTEVATVSDGVVRALSEGVVTIKAIVGSFSSAVVINVIDPVERKIEITGPTEVYVSKEITLTAVLTNLEGDVVWTSSDENVARVAGGVVTGLTTGKVTITATLGKREAKVEVEVLPLPTITIEAESTVVVYGNTLTLVAKTEHMENPTIEWTSSNTKVATVENGVVTPVGKGKTTITAKANEYVATIEITVELPRYAVVFKDKDGNVLKEVEIELGSTTEAPNAPELDGYKFIGWDKDFSKITSDIEINAIYKKILKITYILDGGVFIDMSSVVNTFIDTDTVVLPTPVKTGFKFLGWTLTEDGIEYVTELKASDDVTLYAKYEEKIVLTTFNVGPDKEYKTIASALADAIDGSTIILAAGTYNEDITINLNNITILGPNDKINPNNGTRTAEAVLSNIMVVNSNINGLTLKGLKFTNQSAIKLTGNNVGFIFENNIIEAQSATAGTSGAPIGNIQGGGAVTNLTIINSRFILKGGLAYTSSIYFGGKVTNAHVYDNYFTNDNSTSANVFALWMANLAGHIDVRNNLFYRFAGNYWTAWFGNTAVENNTIIDYIDNVITDENTANPSCGVDFSNIKSETIYVNIIGNTFEACKDTVLSVRGTGNSDNTSLGHVNISYNKFISTFYRLRFGLATTNFYLGKNYTANPFESPNGTINANDNHVDAFTTTEALDAAYAAYKADYVSPFLSINYVLDGGYLSTSNLIVKGKVFTLPSPKKEDHRFLGWTLTPEGTEYITEIPATQTEDVTVYAHWEKTITVTVTYKFNGGYSEALIDANKGDAPSLQINNYNYNECNFWGGGYQTDIFIGTSSYDPGATFSDRIYIKKNLESGLYEIVEVLKSGGSKWPDGAEYLITISNSYAGYYANVNPITRDLEKGMIVIFSKDFSTSTHEEPTTVSFFTTLPECDTLVSKVAPTDSLVVPGYLGFKFLGWFDLEGKLYKSVNDLTQDVTLYARWEELNPVVNIEVTEIPTTMITGEEKDIKAHVLPTDAYFKDLSYTSSNTDIIKVDDKGHLIAVNVGTATITITDYLKKVTIVKEIQILAKPSIDVDFDEPYKGHLKPEEEIQIKASLVGNIPATSVIKFTSKNPEIATVSETGLVKAVKNGYAEIFVEVEGTTYNVTIGICVNALPTDTAIDRLIALLANNSFSVVETGNVSLYNDGRQKVFVSTYGSVNKFLFDEYKVNTDYTATAEANSGGHKSRRPQDTIEFVTVHDTATLTGTVVSIADVMSRGETSIHYTVGNDAIYAVVPEKYIAYHAGDGTGSTFTWTKTNVKATDATIQPTFGVNKESGLYLTINGQKTSIQIPADKKLSILGPVWKVVDGYYYIGGPLWDSSSYATIGSRGGNNNSIGIEMCVNRSGDVYDTWQRTAQLVADICIRNNLDLTRVKMHNTWSGKNCPQCLIEGGYWWNFMEMVAVNYEVMTTYKDAKISMVSNNPDIVDNTGRVIKAPDTTTTVSYTITVELDGETRSITLSSVIPGTTTWEQWNGTYDASVVWNNKKFVR